jgi:hypothetical protein
MVGFPNPFGRKRKTLGRFSLPSHLTIESPSTLTDKLRLATFWTACLGGVLFASLCLSVILVALVIRRADVIAYVADGGVFGCQVKTVAPPGMGHTS